MIREKKEITYEQEIDKQYNEYLAYHYEEMSDKQLNELYKKNYLGEE